MDGIENVDGKAQLEGQHACGWMGLIGNICHGGAKDTERVNNEYKVFEEENIAEARSRALQCGEFRGVAVPKCHSL